ncbi:arginyl-tRNA synthetase [Phascolomyces articulosus]|uniref:arginine--tRNA ligase n=1 Tax=Phascolomyces articulosus TaxID=60185 RepID=A0AAD5PIB8_9FUNG|nr:arginyl-tRNA synthetase [Phascolomyces articulosus]
MSAALRFKRSIVKQLSRLTPCGESELIDFIRVPKKNQEGHYAISLAQIKGSLRDSNVLTEQQQNPIAWSEEIAQKFIPNTYIASAIANGPNITFKVAPTEFIKQVLQQVHEEKERYGWAPHDTTIPSNTKKSTVVIDYSSPNIAKPFHAGHLRSTIHGNFIKRIHQVMGYHVIGINYLGDWGKQYGLLAIGYERYGDREKLEKDPIHHLYDVYVKINQDAKKDPEIDQLANTYFKRMEQGDEDALKQWRLFRELSIESYASIYERLDVLFEVYSGESQVEEFIPKIHARLEEQGLLTKTEDGASVVDLEAYQLDKAIVERADGTSLYLTRDLATLLMRMQEYKFEKMIYVVGEEQEGHFKQLFKTAELLFGSELSERLQHASFGRINGMSTRQGTAVFLQDILDISKGKILDYMQQDKARYDEDLQQQSMALIDTIADQLGVSAILIQDMKAKRGKNYTFSWDRMTDARGDTGVFLQYAHARMCGIERKANTPLRADCDYALLKEQEAFDLVQQISLFPELVESSFKTLEPCTIVNYLFKLSHAISVANNRLRVKNMNPELAASRMMLFWAAKTTLSNGLSLLGLKPIERM